MSEKPSLLGDLLATLWIVVVALVYFGGYFWPNVIGVYTGTATLVYILMLLLAAVIVAFGRMAVRPSVAIDQKHEPDHTESG